MKKNGIVLLAFLIWIVANLGFGWVFGGMSADMTANAEYTLSDTSRSVAENVKSPVDFTLYVSDNLSSYSRRHYRYAGYVTEILSQYQKNNTDNISLDIIRFAPFTAEAREAEKKGIKAVSYNNEYVYFGLEVASGKQSRIISALLPERQPYFESDINRILRDFQFEKKPIIGVMSPEIQLFEKTKRSKIWSLFEEMLKDYRLFKVTDELLYIPPQIEVLLVLDPQKLEPLTLYSLEQYLLAGGKVIMFMDPYSEIEHFYRGYPPQGTTNLGGMLRNWGIIYNPKYVVGNAATAMQTEDGTSYPLWFMTATENYKKLSFHSAGSFAIDPVKGLEYEVLIKTPENSGRMETANLRYSTRKGAAKYFKNENQVYNLAVKITGDFLSEYDDSLAIAVSNNGDMPPFLPISVGGSELVLIADSDFASNEGWVVTDDEKNPIYGSTPYADNAEFILSLVDAMTEKYKDFPATSLPKYTDDNNIIKYITRPLADAVREERNGLINDYEDSQKALKEAERLAVNKEFDAGSGLQYRQIIDDMRNIVEESKSQLDFVDKILVREIEKSLRNIFILNLLVCPLIILLLLFGICFVSRKINLKRLK